MMPNYSAHAKKRMSQRNLSPQDVGYVIAYGEKYRQAGALIYFLRKRDIPWWDQDQDRWTRLVGTAVILTKDGRRVITVWRNRQTGSKKLRCKPVYSLTPEQLDDGGWAG
jgi:hypothetical protein